MTKTQQRKALWGLITGWGILFGVGAIFKLKMLIMMAPVFLVFAMIVWFWRTVDTLNEIKKSNKSKNPKTKKSSNA